MRLARVLENLVGIVILGRKLWDMIISKYLEIDNPKKACNNKGKYDNLQTTTQHNIYRVGRRNLQ